MEEPGYVKYLRRVGTSKRIMMWGSHVKYIDIKIDPEQKRKLCPFMVEKFLQKEINIPAQQISGKRNGYTIRSTSEITSNKVEEIKYIMGVECTIQDHKLFNRSKGLH